MPHRRVWRADASHFFDVGVSKKSGALIWPQNSRIPHTTTPKQELPPFIETPKLPDCSFQISVVPVDQDLQTHKLPSSERAQTSRLLPGRRVAKSGEIATTDGSRDKAGLAVGGDKAGLAVGP